MPAVTFATSANASAKIASDTIEVRSVCLLSCPDEIERLRGYLCAGERERADRFHFQADYDRYVVARAALRAQFGAFLDCDPRSLSFQYTSYGKPFIANCGIEFNLSHSGDWVLLAFTRMAEIGIDIEGIRPMHDMRDVAGRISPRTNLRCGKQRPNRTVSRHSTGAGPVRNPLSRRLVKGFPALWTVFR